MTSLADFDALSFDCYGTLIDWEAGIGAVLAPWAAREGITLSTDALLERYASAEAREEHRLAVCALSGNPCRGDAKPRCKCRSSGEC